MLFNSIDFAIFLPVVFALYWWLNGRRAQQNVLINLASYLFYGWWDWRFLVLILFSTIVDYTIGLWLYRENHKKTKKILLWSSIAINLGLLGFFKYYNFFVDNFVSNFQFFGKHFEPSSLDILLPVGISFYTFQTLSYTIDIYRGKLKPTKNFVSFAAFVSFFPQLVAGPIERAANLLPQFQRDRVFDYNKSVDGLRQILWGLFKKMVIADNCAALVNEAFNDPSSEPGSKLLLIAILFVFQVYGDFSGYSDIAIGTARLFGFNLSQNFAFPLFSRDMPELWRRWHISLSSWFRDYLYVPMGGSKGGHIKKARNLMVLFLVMGVWHGSNWTFIVWGGINGLYILPKFLMNTHRKYLGTIAERKALPSFTEMFLMLRTWVLFGLSCVVIRAQSLEDAWLFLSRIFSSTFLIVPSASFSEKRLFFLIFLFLAVEWKGREGKHTLEKFMLSWKGYQRQVMYFVVFVLILTCAGGTQQFYYFQF